MGYFSGDDRFPGVVVIRQLFGLLRNSGEA